METTNINYQINLRKTVKEKVLVRCKDVRYCYKSGNEEGRHWHLGPFSLEIYERELLGILGPSGCGKTTLLRVLTGLATPKTGAITIADRIVFDETLNVVPEKRKVGMMFQEHALFPHLTVRQNIVFGIRNWQRDDRERRLYELESLLGLNEYLNRYPHELSGGQQQRVALARTLAPKPQIILLDEPLSNIDADLRMSLAQELKSVLKQTKTTAVWVTHDQTEALDLADRIMVLNDGKVEQVDTPWNLYNNPRTRFVADFVGHAVFINGEMKGKTILTEVGTIDYLPCLESFKKLEVMIRPDDVQAYPYDAGIGTVMKRQFLGSNQLYSIRLPSGQTLLSNQPSHINWPIGTKMRIELKLKSIVAFPKLK
ncbi:MAG TPA: ABC transporter ATP-binding protein [Candidatus Omnitrophota bacterium]|nr:ABC transporter ATP-binding protein [Candidatus Omnitrophota bacterium]